MRRAIKLPGKETKSQKITLVMRPSVLKNANKIAHMKNDSVNNILNDLLEAYVAENMAYVQRYDECIEV